MRIQKLIFLGITIFVLISCKETSTEKKVDNSAVIANPSKRDSLNNQEAINYYRFKPDTITGLQIKDFQIDDCYQLSDRKLITGYYEPLDGKIIFPDTEKDYGRRLLFLNNNNNDILFKSKGVGDTYLYEPYFFKNDRNGKTLVICQLAFEYFCGGNLFLIDNNNIKYIGNIDVESSDSETKMVDIVRISEKKDKMTISFNAKSLILEPGSKDLEVKNKNVIYVYDGKIFKLIK